MVARYSGNHIRLAVVTDVDHAGGVVSTEWMDQTSGPGPDVPIPHPYAGKGGEGIFTGISKGQILALDSAAYERWIPVATIPLRGYYGDLSGTDEIDFQDVGFPVCNDGEIIIQGKTGAALCFFDNGDISTTNSFGEGSILCGESDSSHRCSINISTPVEYTISETGIRAHGLIRRDVRIEDSDIDFGDFLTDPTSEQVLEEVGWDPSRKVTYISQASNEAGDAGKSDDKILRNPAFVEDRQTILEYGRQWIVDSHADEEQIFEKDDFSLRDALERRERRSNVLSLSLEHPNELFERVTGTLVDVFGNLIDINRNIIPIPTGRGKDLLKDTYEKVRHTVAFHMELNARKGWGYRHDSKGNKPGSPFKSGPDALSSANNARDRSRWSIDVDKEGLTKINIPASSETGNVPRLTRYETSSVIEVDDKGDVKDKPREGRNSAKLFRNIENKDILIDQFGPGGITVKGDKTENRLKDKKTSWKDSAGSQATLPTFVEHGTAFHDITSTAAALLKENINKRASDIFTNPSVTEGVSAINVEVDPQVPTSSSEAIRDPKTGLVTGQPNAGGRSLHLSLDGSLEASLGANTVDRVSCVLDTAGALVARLGRDRQGRSAIVHADGMVAIEVGGFDFMGESSTDEVDTRFVGRGTKRTKSLPGDPKRFRSGKVVLRVRRANSDSTDAEATDSLIIIDETGITIQTAGRMNFVSDMNMTLSSKSLIVLDAPQVQVYKSTPKFLRRDSRTA